MKIVFEHTGILPVNKYGGTERILFWLMKELVELGHEVILIGDPSSRVKDIGVKLIKRANLKIDWRKLIPNNVDIINLFYTPAYKVDHPLLVQIGGNGQVGEVFHPNTIFVSKKHAELHGSKSFVHNGIALKEYPFKRKASKNWENFFFLAKAKWKVKNLKDCIRGCKSLKKKLHVAGGKRSWRDLSFYTKYYGMLSQEKKVSFMNNKDAFLWPVRWHEPFGIAVIEAYSQGIPVISSSYGSLPELVNKKTGIICNNYDEFFQGLSLSKNPFDAEYIRYFCETYFSARKMTLNYIKYYEKVIKGIPINNIPPRTKSKIPPETLLHF